MIKKFNCIVLMILLSSKLLSQTGLFDLKGQAVLSFTDSKSNDEIIEQCRSLAMVNMFETLAMLPIEMINLDCAFGNITDLQFVEENITEKKVMVMVEAKIESQFLFDQCMNSN